MASKEKEDEFIDTASADTKKAVKKLLFEKEILQKLPNQLAKNRSDTARNSRRQFSKIIL